MWVTFDKSDARSLLRDEHVVYAHSPTNRSLKNLATQPRARLAYARSVRPRVLLTTGAGVAVPFAWLGRLQRRADRLRRELHADRGALAHGPARRPDRASRLRAVARDGESRPQGALRRERVRSAMIFVSVGTHEAPFDRMLRAVYDLELDEELVVQYGPSTIRSERALEAEYLSFDEVVELHPAVACRRHARGRRLRDDLARERQAADRDGPAAASSASTWTTTSSSSRGGWRRAGSSPSSTTPCRVGGRRSQATVSPRGG